MIKKARLKKITQGEKTKIIRFVRSVQLVRSEFFSSMQLHTSDRAKTSMRNMRIDHERVYGYQFDCANKENKIVCSKFSANSNHWHENHSCYHRRLESRFLASRTGGDPFSNIICDEFVVDNDQENLQHKIKKELTNSEDFLHWSCLSCFASDCSKLSLPTKKSNIVKTAYKGNCHVICKQIRLLFQTKGTNFMNFKRCNMRCAKLYCCKKQQIQRTYLQICTALSILQAITRYIKKTLQLTYIMFIILIMLTQVKHTTQSLLIKTIPLASDNTSVQSTENVSDLSVYNNSNNKYQKYTKGNDSGIFSVTKSNMSIASSSVRGINNGYLDKLDNLEKSLAAVLIKVAYGTTSTTKRSIPDSNYAPSLTTIATPLLTTLRYQDKQQQSQFKHHRNYELDLERDHALPTSAPNADILKSNSNPTYPNPNRHHVVHERERHRHMSNSTPLPSLPNLLKKSNNRSPTLSMLSGGAPPAYSPPVRSFFTPPLPPGYQHPFADKPTLRGTNNEGAIVSNAATTYVQRRPIPPPSLMPGHERIPFRPGEVSGSSSIPYLISDLPIISSSFYVSTVVPHQRSQQTDVEGKKALNTPSKSNLSPFHVTNTDDSDMRENKHEGYDKQYKNQISNQGQVLKEVIPSIRRILSGSNGRKSDVPDVLLKRVTSSSKQQQLPSSPMVVIDSTLLSKDNTEDEKLALTANTNINKSVLMKIPNNNASVSNQVGDYLKTQVLLTHNSHIIAVSTPTSAITINNSIDVVPSFVSSSTIAIPNTSTDFSILDINKRKNDAERNDGSSSTSNLASADLPTNGTWSVAWNVHVYLSVILFTILAVYSLYKMLTYNKLTHLFAQSYFVCIHLVLIIICTMRIFYLCYDAYNIHASFPIFVSEILLNLPSTFLTISFSVLVLFLSLKSLNHKNNRYSALIRPLTVVVGCGVHVILCVTLHYVESYTLHQHYQQHMINQQQQQLLRRHQMQFQQQYLHSNLPQNLYQQHHLYNNVSSYSNHPGESLQQPNIITTNVTTAPPPPRVLSLICQIIYIFVCFTLGFLYLYLYRVLKRILRSKSQNYIHGYQNLSYAIHITIATALLFILLAALQIFGAISITSTTRSLILQTNTETDWLHWGYQFSLRLIEIAIITLISWVTGLTTTSGSTSSGGSRNINVGIVNGEARLCTSAPSVSINSAREKSIPTHQLQTQQNHSSVAGFFLPCTSTSNQEQFENDYPVVCNANANLHMYTMRTGKLIYDDSFVLSSLGSKNNCGDILSARTNNGLHQNSDYNNESLSNANINEYDQSRRNHTHNQQSQYIDCVTDNTPDHYENPNFDLKDSDPINHNGMGINEIQSYPKTRNTNVTKVLSSNESNSESNTNSAASQQQILLLQSESYSEPCAQDYEYGKFECAAFGGSSNHQKSTCDTWMEIPGQNTFNKRDLKNPSTNTLERHGYEKAERRSANGNYFGGGNIRFTNYNSYERSSQHSGVRKSETLITLGNIVHGRNASSSSAASSTSTCGAPSSTSDVQSKLTLSGDNRYHQHHHHNHNNYLLTSVKGSWVNHYEMPRVNTQQHQQHQHIGNTSSVIDDGGCATIERVNLTTKQQQSNKSSDVNTLGYSDDDDDDELMLSATGNHRL